jgi:plastocyanin
MRKLRILLMVVALAVVTSNIAGAADNEVVSARGTEQFKPNALFRSTFRFSPGSIEVASGESVTWVDRDALTGPPHTITIVASTDVPEDLESIFLCREPGGACRAALDAHFPAGPPVFVVNVGNPGLDSAGDSLFLPPEGSVSEVVSAPAGTTLNYICAFHPWQQGSIRVEQGGGEDDDDDDDDD